MDFRAKRLTEGVSPATCNKQLREIESARSDAVDAGWLHTNPLWRWKSMQVREPDKRVRVVERDEFAKLLEAAVLPEFRALLSVAYFAGLRREELCQLRWDAVNFDRGVLHVENRPEDGGFTKTGKNRALPMHHKTTTSLRRLHEAAPRIVTGGTLSPKRPRIFGWDDGRPFKPDWVARQFAKIVEKAGVKACRLHDLRRSFSTMAQRADVDVGTVTDLDGWSTTSVVKKHSTGALPEAFTKAMKKIEAAAEAVA